MDNKQLPAPPPANDALPLGRSGRFAFSLDDTSAIPRKSRPRRNVFDLPPERSTTGRGLIDALDYALATRWAGRRSCTTNRGQALSAIRTLWGMGRLDVDAVTAADLRAAAVQWQRRGLSPGSINKRLNCLSVLGVNVKGSRVRNPQKLKWWLRPQDLEKLRADMPKLGGALTRQDFLDYVTWASLTGLRVEETLRLTPDHFSAWTTTDGTERLSVTVPGLKTAMAHATLPLSVGAAALIRPRLDRTPPGRRLFATRYHQLARVWRIARKLLGQEGNPTATLKAIRRSAARALHAEAGMPLDLVRHYLRHESINTTMGYLRLTGGYGEEEIRKWL